VACATSDQPLPLPAAADETTQAVIDAGIQGLVVGCNLVKLEDICKMTDTIAEHLDGIDTPVNNVTYSFPWELSY